MILNLEHLPRVIPVGIQTESGVETIGFDLSPWVTRWPGMTYAVWPTRPGESASYIAADTELVGNVLYWYPNAADTEKEGAGTVEVVGIGGGKCKSTGVIDTLIKKTSLDVTQETPEPIKPWFESVLQAANDVKASVDAGQGGLYIVNVVRRGELQARYADRSQEEIREAVAAGKTCVLVNSDGRVCVYIGEKEYPHDPYPVCPTFVAPMEYKQGQGFAYWQMQVLPSGGIAEPGYKPAKTPNPKKLTIKVGETTTKYDGSEDVELKIPDGIPDPGKANMQLVSDEDGKAVWEERLAYKHVRSGTMTLFAEETLMDDPEDPGMYFSSTPLAAMPEVGKTYDVTINGTVYNTTAHSKEEDGVQIAVVLGNTKNLDPEVYPDTGEPFMLFLPLPELQAMMGGMSVIMVTDIAADSITLSINGQATITDIKKIDPEYLPDTHKTITIMIDADGNVMCDTPFSEVSKMTCGELQSALKVVKTGSYGGQPASLEADVQVRRRTVEGIGEMLEITFRQFADPGDVAAGKEATRYIYWTSYGLQLQKFTLYSLPVMDHWGYDQQTCYLRSENGSWQPATIDQLKADLGHITVTAQINTTLAISNISMKYADALAALKKGAHMQLMLTRPDGFTEIYPAVGYSDTNIAFIMLPSHDTAWAIEWTESGMTKILSGND